MQIHATCDYIPAKASDVFTKTFLLPVASEPSVPVSSLHVVIMSAVYDLASQAKSRSGSHSSPPDRSIAQDVIKCVADDPLAADALQNTNRSEPPHSSLSPVVSNLLMSRHGVRVIFPQWSLLFLYFFVHSVALVGNFLGSERVIYDPLYPPSCLSAGRCYHGRSQFVPRTLADSSGRRDESPAPHDHKIEPGPLSSRQLKHLYAPPFS